MAFTVITAFGALLVTYLFLGVIVPSFFRLLLDMTQDAKEPPSIVTGLPFVGPLVGIIRERSNFYLRLRSGTCV